MHKRVRLPSCGLHCGLQPTDISEVSPVLKGSRLTPIQRQHTPPPPPCSSKRICPCCADAALGRKPNSPPKATLFHTSY